MGKKPFIVKVYMFAFELFEPFSSISQILLFYIPHHPLSTFLLIARVLICLQLTGILLDTGNLTGPHCTTKDKYMATLLVNGAGRFGSNGLYQLCMFCPQLLCAIESLLLFYTCSVLIYRTKFVFAVRYKMYDTSDLTVVDILRKDFKKWTRVGLDLY